METFAGRYYDGKTALGYDVTVAVSASGLAIAGGPEGEMLWAGGDLAAAPGGEGELRLSLRSDPDRRLILPEAARVAVHAISPQVHDRASARDRMIMLLIALTVASVAVIGLVFFGAPMAAEPLARSTPRQVEIQLGENVASQVAVFMPACKGAEAEAAQAAIAPLVAQLEKEANAGFPIAFGFARNPEPNAFALPGGHVRVTAGLLDVLEAPDELAAVIAHEIGHVRARDGMVALYRNAGLGILLEIVTGGSGLAQQLILISGQLTDLSYTRAQERRADEAAIETLAAAGYDPGALARAFRRMEAAAEAENQERKEKRGEGEGASTPGWARIPEWLSSHPDIAERIKAAEKATIAGRPQPLDPAAWALVKAACSAKKEDAEKT